MAFQFPANRTNWVCTQNNDKLPDIVNSFNINLDKEGYVRLSKRTVQLINNDANSNYDLPLGIYETGYSEFYVATDEDCFDFDLVATAGSWNITEDTSTDNPSGDVDSSTCIFGGDMVYTESTDVHTLNLTTGTWTDRAVTLTTGKRHPCANFKSKNWLAIADGNTILTYTSAYASGTTCTIPAGEEIVAVAYNAGYLGFATLSEYGGGTFYVWDGNQTAANYAYSVGSNRVFWITPYKNTFVLMTGELQLLYWTPSGLLPLEAMPLYYTQGGANDRRNVYNYCIPNSVTTLGDTILFNHTADNENVDEFNQPFMMNNAGGIYCYDPIAGIYHKYAHSGAQIIQNKFANTAINTTDNTITVTTAPATGTPCYLHDATGDIGGLMGGVTYYIINVNATTVKLATTRANAVAGTAIDITSAGSVTSAHGLFAFPETDFGQLYGSVAGAVMPITQVSEGNSPVREIAFGAFTIPSDGSTPTSTEQNLCVAIDGIPNRGHITLAKMYANGLSDDWQKVLIRSNKLKTAEDKLIVKVKTYDGIPISSLTPTLSDDATKVGTWSDTNTFTTPLDLSDAEVGDEVFIFSGECSGYAAHITSLSLNTGTWTVNIDEDLPCTAARTFFFLIDKFQKLSTITNQSVTNEDGYFDVPINKKARWCQVKVEMRGTNITIDDIILLNAPHKPIA